MLEVRGLSVELGGRAVLDSVDLDVASGEIVAVLGPSGSGKTTLLRAIAGLQRAAAGDIYWRGRNLDEVPAHRRNFGLMFQDHALFPHLDVAGNVAFGLRGQADAGGRVEEVLALVELGGASRRRVETLSGGERQRVALARALAPRPQLLMFDEPVGSLDRPLRSRLLDDLRRILDVLGVASIYVTHDRDEAFSIADRAVILRDGSVAGRGTAMDLWRDPGSAWVASLLGLENLVEVEGGMVGPIPINLPDGAALIRPEAVIVGRGGPLAATVVSVRPDGLGYATVLDLGAGVQLVAAGGGALHHPGDTVRVSIKKAEPISG